MVTPTKNQDTSTFHKLAYDISDVADFQIARRYVVICKDCSKELTRKSAFWFSMYPRCLNCQRKFKKKTREEQRKRSLEEATKNIG